MLYFEQKQITLHPKFTPSNFNKNKIKRNLDDNMKAKTKRKSNKNSDFTP